MSIYLSFKDLVCVLVLKGTCKSPNHIRMDPMGVIFVCIDHLPTL